MINNPEFADYAAKFPEYVEAMHNSLPVPMVEPRDISNTVLHLCSAAGRYITGVAMPVDAGAINY